MCLVYWSQRKNQTVDWASTYVSSNGRMTFHFTPTSIPSYHYKSIVFDLNASKKLLKGSSWSLMLAINETNLPRFCWTSRLRLIRQFESRRLRKDRRKHFQAGKAEPVKLVTSRSTYGRSPTDPVYSTGQVKDQGPISYGPLPPCPTLNWSGR